MAQRSYRFAGERLYGESGRCLLMGSCFEAQAPGQGLGIWGSRGNYKYVEFYGL